MNERRADILKAAVREFTETGEPISSGWLYEHYNFGIKPAMIRLELRELADEGYLFQSNHSAGKTPTDKGYEFFAKEALEEEPRKSFEKFVDLFMKRDISAFLDSMSEELGLLSVAREMKSEIVYKEGLDELVSNLEWDSRSEIESVIKDFELLDGRLGHLEKVMKNNSIKIFIGRKSPVTRSECLSVFAGEYNVGGNEFLLLGIGPKRMDYEKTATIFKGLKKVKGARDK